MVVYLIIIIGFPIILLYYFYHHPMTLFHCFIATVQSPVSYKSGLFITTVHNDITQDHCPIKMFCFPITIVLSFMTVIHSLITKTISIIIITYYLSQCFLISLLLFSHHSQWCFILSKISTVLLFLSRGLVFPSQIHYLIIWSKCYSLWQCSTVPTYNDLL